MLTCRLDHCPAKRGGGGYSIVKLYAEVHGSRILEMGFEIQSLVGAPEAEKF